MFFSVIDYFPQRTNTLKTNELMRVSELFVLKLNFRVFAEEISKILQLELLQYSRKTVYRNNT